MLKGIVLYIAMAYTLCLHTNAQQVSLFQSITTRDGLPSNYVFDAMEDVNGLLWIGTDKGLARYDGFRWQLFNTDNGLPGNYIGMIKPAGENGLWLGISAKGLYYYNTSRNNCTFVTSNYLTHYFQTDHKGNLFLYQRDNTNAAFIKAGWISPDNPATVNPAFSFNERATKYYACADFRKRKVLLLLPQRHKPTKADKFTVYPGWNADTISVTACDRAINSPVEDNIYADATTLTFYENSKEVRKVVLFDTSNQYLNTLRYQNQTVAWNEKDGLYLIGDKGTIKHYTDKDGLASNMVTDVHVLKNGRLLVSTLGGGLSYKLPEGNALLNTGGMAVKGLAQKKDYLLAVLENKVLRFGLRQKDITLYPTADKQIQSIDVIDNTIFISSLRGLSVNREADNTLQQIKSVPIGAGICNVIKVNGRLLAGSYGINVVELKGSSLIRDTATPFVSEKIQAFSNGFASYNYEDGLQFTFNNGAKVNLSEKNGLPSNAVYHVHENKDTFWISTQKGVAAYSNGKVVKTIGPADGLLGNRCVFSFHDSSNNFWILTDKYLGKFTGKKVITNISLPVKDGANDFIQHALFNPEYNTLVTGTQKNICITQLNAIGWEPMVPKPLLKKIIKNGEEITNRSFEIPLNYSQLVFEFNPYFANPFGKSSIFYKLKGQDETFYELRDSLSIHFSKLRSGRYQLVAKAINEDGIESEEILLCTFRVKKPFLQTGWFILLIILASGFLAHIIATAYQKNKQRQKEQERKLEQQLINERERISRELHDNLGSSLVTIIAQSDNIETKLRYNQADDALKKIQELSDQSRDTMNILRETIWAVQEQSHSFESFVNRIRDYLQRSFAVTSIECNCDAEGSLEKPLSPEQTLNLFRSIQECTQNIIKHSGATASSYLFLGDSDKATVIIKDNGKGFDTNKAYSSNGIKNITNRIKEIQGKAEIISGPNTGTTITIKIPV